jgi:hypothetical protein
MKGSIYDHLLHMATVHTRKQGNIWKGHSAQQMNQWDYATSSEA